MYYPEFRNMHEIYKDDQSEHYKLSVFDVPEPDMFSKMTNPEYGGQLEQKVVVLRDRSKGEIVMSDSWMEQETNISFVKKAHGDVLIGGLGMGMILLAMQDKKEVTSVTVVELDKNLHDLVIVQLKEHLNDKVEIVFGDINDFHTEKQFDTIYCDIWNDISGDNLKEMEELSINLGEFLNKDNPGSFISHWREKKTIEMWREDHGIDEEEYEFY